MTEQNLSFIGLMKRAGALIPGADGIYDAARAGSLIRLILLASDAGPNTKKGLLNAKEECGAPMIELDATKAQLGAILGQKECAAAAIFPESGSMPNATAESWPRLVAKSIFPQPEIFNAAAWLCPEKFSGRSGSVWMCSSFPSMYRYAAMMLASSNTM